MRFFDRSFVIQSFGIFSCFFKIQRTSGRSFLSDRPSDRVWRCALHTHTQIHTHTRGDLASFASSFLFHDSSFTIFLVRELVQTLVRIFDDSGRSPQIVNAVEYRMPAQSPRIIRHHVRKRGKAFHKEPEQTDTQRTSCDSSPTDSELTLSRHPVPIRECYCGRFVWEV